MSINSYNNNINSATTTAEQACTVSKMLAAYLLSVQEYFKPTVQCGFNSEAQPPHIEKITRALSVLEQIQQAPNNAPFAKLSKQDLQEVRGGAIDDFGFKTPTDQGFLNVWGLNHNNHADHLINSNNYHKVVELFQPVAQAIIDFNMSNYHLHKNETDFRNTCCFLQAGMSHFQDAVKKIDASENGKESVSGNPFTPYQFSNPEYGAIYTRLVKFNKYAGEVLKPLAANGILSLSPTQYQEFLVMVGEAFSCTQELERLGFHEADYERGGTSLSYVRENIARLYGTYDFVAMGLQTENTSAR
jgi:hypothetical protein